MKVPMKALCEGYGQRGWITLFGPYELVLFERNPDVVVHAVAYREQDLDALIRPVM